MGLNEIAMELLLADNKALKEYLSELQVANDTMDKSCNHGDYHEAVHKCLALVKKAGIILN